MDGSRSFALFVGGVSAIVAWLVGACILWRDRTMTRAGEATVEEIVVCTQCGYALNGLHEARCPECGQVYTLDALFLAQPARHRGEDIGGK